jgi:hypothetical protein
MSPLAAFPLALLKSLLPFRSTPRVSGLTPRRADAHPVDQRGGAVRRRRTAPSPACTPPIARRARLAFRTRYRTWPSRPTGWRKTHRRCLRASVRRHHPRCGPQEYRFTAEQRFPTYRGPSPTRGLRPSYVVYFVTQVSRRRKLDQVSGHWVGQLVGPAVPRSPLAARPRPRNRKSWGADKTAGKPTRPPTRPYTTLIGGGRREDERCASDRDRHLGPPLPMSLHPAAP